MFNLYYFAGFTEQELKSTQELGIILTILLIVLVIVGFAVSIFFLPRLARSIYLRKSKTSKLLTDVVFKMFRALFLIIYLSFLSYPIVEWMTSGFSILPLYLTFWALLTAITIKKLNRLGTSN
jgi:cytochrome b561